MKLSKDGQGATPHSTLPRERQGKKLFPRENYKTVTEYRLTEQGTIREQNN